MTLTVLQASAASLWLCVLQDAMAEHSLRGVWWLMLLSHAAVASSSVLYHFTHDARAKAIDEAIVPVAIVLQFAVASSLPFARVWPYYLTLAWSMFVWFSGLAQHPVLHASMHLCAVLGNPPVLRALAG